MPLGKGGVYRYLGVFKSNVFDTAQMKTLQQEFLDVGMFCKLS